MVTVIPKDVLDSKILPQIPISRLGKPEEVAGLIIYLCSQEAAFVTGANLAINGGASTAIAAPADAGSRAVRSPVDKAMQAPGLGLAVLLGALLIAVTVALAREPHWPPR